MWFKWRDWHSFFSTIFLYQYLLSGWSSPSNSPSYANSASHNAGTLCIVSSKTHYQCGDLNKGAWYITNNVENVKLLVLWIWANVDIVVTKPIIELNITYWISDFTKDSQDVHSEGIRGEKKSGLQNRNLYSKIGSISFCGLLWGRFTMAEILKFVQRVWGIFPSKAAKIW